MSAPPAANGRPAVRVTTLPSGLRVVTDAMPGVASASLGVWVSVGTRHEQAEENGVAHFLEHMAFKGTERRSARAIAEEVEAVGGHLNAYTAREQTAYYARVLGEDAPLALDVIADILQHSLFEPEEVERERQVILQEIGQANDTPDDIIFDHFQETAFPDQPMGRPTLGREALIRALPRAALTGYLGRHYAPANLVLAAAGAVEHEAVVALATRLFDSLPAAGAAAAPPPLDPARYRGGEFREERDLDQVHVVLGFPSVPYRDPDHYPVMLLSTLFGGGMSSRLFQEVREKRGLVYSIYSFASPYSDAGLFALYAGTGEQEVAELVPVVLEEIAKVQRDVTEEELARAKAQLKAGVLMGLESTASRSEQIARQMQVYGRPIPPEETVAKIMAVDTAQVMAAASRLFRGHPTLAALGPLGKVPRFSAVAEGLTS